MSHQSLFLHARPGAVDTAATGRQIVEHLRRDGGAGRWSFQRIDAGAGETVGLWFHADLAALDDLRTMIPTTYPWLIDDHYRAPGASLSHERELTTALTLAELSSELALDLAGTDADPLQTAVTHLALLASHSPAVGPAFLFECWREWSTFLGERDRVDLVTASRHDVGPVVPSQGEPWTTYERGLLSVLADAPQPYLLFDHLLLTHNRLGLDALTTSRAALAVRRAVMTPVRPSPVTPAVASSAGV